MQPFISRYANQQITDNSGNFKGECLSLIKRYAQEIQGVPNADTVLHAVNGGAKDLWLSPSDLQNQYYDRVDSPQEGDFAVYTNGTYGDVAVYIGNGEVFGQLGTPVFQPAAVRAVGTPAGYLRLKGSDMPTTEEILQSALNDARHANDVLASALNDARSKAETFESALNVAREELAKQGYKPYDGPTLYTKE